MADPEIDLLLEAVRLKALARTGWVRRGVLAPESVAAHSWGVSWLVLVLLPDSLDRSRALAYATLHDLAEVRVGDLTPSDPVSKADKARLEHAAMRDLCDRVPRGTTLWRLFEAYEAQDDEESRFVRQLDRLDMAIQAVAYAEQGATGMAEFIRSAAHVVTHPVLRPTLEACAARIGVVLG